MTSYNYVITLLSFFSHSHSLTHSLSLSQHLITVLLTSAMSAPIPFACRSSRGTLNFKRSSQQTLVGEVGPNLIIDIAISSHPCTREASSQFPCLHGNFKVLYISLSFSSRFGLFCSMLAGTGYNNELVALDGKDSKKPSSCLRASCERPFQSPLFSALQRAFSELNMRTSSSSMRVPLSIYFPANIPCLFPDVGLIVQSIGPLVSILAVFDIVYHVCDSSFVVHITARSYT